MVFSTTTMQMLNNHHQFEYVRGYTGPSKSETSNFAMKFGYPESSTESSQRGKEECWDTLRGVNECKPE